MDAMRVQKVVIDVIRDLQVATGEMCPPLKGSDVPSKVIETFDSTVWPLATTRIARALNVTIPNHVHIFGGERGKPLLTIKQTSQMVCDKHTSRADDLKRAA